MDKSQKREKEKANELIGIDLIVLIIFLPTNRHPSTETDRAAINF